MTQTMYEGLLTDVMGTITDTRTTVGDQHKYILGSEEAQKAIVDELGPEYVNIAQVLEAGNAAAKTGQKDTPEFQNMIEASDIGAKIGYESGAISMGLFPEVKSALRDVDIAGCKVVVYSSGGVESTTASIESAGLDGIIERCYSSKEADIGSKSKANAYRAIAAKECMDVSDMVYVADSVDECEAAVDAGYGKVFFIDRKAVDSDLGNHEDGYTVINSYSAVAGEIVSEDHAESEDSSGEAEA